MKTNANWAGRTAAFFTAVSHRRAPIIRWGVMAALAGAWIGAGYVGWRAQDEAPPDAFYRTLAALGLDTGLYDPEVSASELTFNLQLTRYAGFFLPLIGLVFAFSGQLGQSIARLFCLFVNRHVVIVGDGHDALALAQSCVRAGDVVALVGSRYPEETAYDLRISGVLLFEGDASRPQTLRAARAPWARRMVILAGEDAACLQIEAAASASAKRVRRRKPLVVHVALRSTLLLEEARAMRAAEMQKNLSVKRGKKAFSVVDARPFSLDEIGARRLLVQETPAILALAEQTGQKRPHLAIMGFDETAEAIAVRALMSLWSARFEVPRVTVLVPDPADAEARFRARYPQAQAHAIWQADLVFAAADWRRDAMDFDALQQLIAARGPVSAFVVSTGVDAENIGLALALRRACNYETEPGKPLAPAPIFMKETSESEFSKLYAAGDTTDRLDAYLQAFGGWEEVATRALVIEGALDRGAAIAHEMYGRSVSSMGRKELEAASRAWEDIPETYRNANRATADSAGVKLWDAGYAPAGKKSPAAVDNVELSDWIDRLAEREHDRWVAERLLSGWRPGAVRNNELRIHPMIRPFSELSADEVEKDREQVRAAIAILRAMHTHGFVRRPQGAITG